MPGVLLISSFRFQDSLDLCPLSFVLFFIFHFSMSDGNFNRQLLPKTELSTGLRAGKAQMRSKAEHALKEILDEYFPNITPDPPLPRNRGSGHKGLGS